MARKKLMPGDIGFPLSLLLSLTRLFLDLMFVLFATL